jgi:uncharacterized membrane protein YtjA (UPF0391 family)
MSGLQTAACEWIARLSLNIGTHSSGEKKMLYYSVVFLVIALIAGALGFFGVAGAAVGIAKILFFVFLVLFVVSLVLGRRAGPTI